MKFPIKSTSFGGSSIAILVGFAAILGLVVFVTIIGLRSLEELSQHSSVIVNDHMAKIEATTQMQKIARQRVVTMQKMTLIEDPFERDELSMSLDILSSKFAASRISLMNMPLSQQEKDLLKEQGQKTGIALPIQRRISDLLAEDRLNEASIMLVRDAIPAQDEVLLVLDEIYKMQLSAATIAAKQAQQTYFSSRQWMLSLALGALILGAIIAMLVVRKTARASQERERHLVKIEKMNAALQESATNLIGANQQALLASEAKSAFLANMSHEIRTPLTAIIGFSESMLEEKLVRSEGKDAAETIAKNGRHLLHVINEILDLSKIEAGKLELEKIVISPYELFADVIASVELQAQEKDLDIEVDYQFPLPESIATDPLRLKQVLINLCNNAIKFTRQGGIVVTVGMDAQKAQLSISVEDSGIGMSQEQLDCIFEAFSQADITTTRRFGGTGLGLTISKLLTDNLGATLNVSSIPNQGSIFQVLLPLSEAEMATQIVALPTEKQKESSNIEWHEYAGTVLLAEDSVDNQKLICHYLQKAGIKIILANNGREAVEQSMAEEVDLILMDMQMPIMGGLEATGLIRAVGNTTPIVALTANVMGENIDQYRQVGCTDFLAKPVDRKRFLEVLDQYLPRLEEVDEEEVDQDDIFQDPEFKELVNAFLQRLPQQMSAMESALNDGQWNELAGVAHQLKGTGGSFGFPQITKIAAELERAARSADPAASNLFSSLAEYVRQDCYKEGQSANQ